MKDGGGYEVSPLGEELLGKGESVFFMSVTSDRLSIIQEIHSQGICGGQIGLNWFKKKHMSTQT